MIQSNQADNESNKYEEKDPINIGDVVYLNSDLTASRPMKVCVRNGDRVSLISIDLLENSKVIESLPIDFISKLPK